MKEKSKKMKMYDNRNQEPEIEWGALKPDIVESKKKDIGDKVGKTGIFKGSKGIYDTRNRLNDLTGKEWVLFSKSWFIHNPPPRKKNEQLHPAKFPESLIEDFIRFFTKKRDLVLDPMVGTGSTLVACEKSGRKGIGIELSEKWGNIAKQRTSQKVIIGDAHELEKILNENNIQSVDFCITSPPYWNMLHKSRGNVKSVAKQRKEIGLDESYSNNQKDLGNIENYENYLLELNQTYSQVYKILKNGGYFVVICQNILTENGEMVPFAWDLAKKLSQTFILKQERIWLQNNKMLGSWGYPFRYVSNVHHHYCLVFEKPKLQVIEILKEKPW